MLTNLKLYRVYVTLLRYSRVCDKQSVIQISELINGIVDNTPMRETGNVVVYLMNEQFDDLQLFRPRSRVASEHFKLGGLIKAYLQASHEDKIYKDVNEMLACLGIAVNGDNLRQVLNNLVLDPLFGNLMRFTSAQISEVPHQIISTASDILKDGYLLDGGDLYNAYPSPAPISLRTINAVLRSVSGDRDSYFKSERRYGAEVTLWSRMGDYKNDNRFLEWAVRETPGIYLSLPLEYRVQSNLARLFLHNSVNIHAEWELIPGTLRDDSEFIVEAFDAMIHTKIGASVLPGIFQTLSPIVKDDPRVWLAAMKANDGYIYPRLPDAAHELLELAVMAVNTRPYYQEFVSPRLQADPAFKKALEEAMARMTPDGLTARLELDRHLRATAEMW